MTGDSRKPNRGFAGLADLAGDIDKEIDQVALSHEKSSARQKSGVENLDTSMLNSAESLKSPQTNGMPSSIHTGPVEENSKESEPQQKRGFAGLAELVNTTDEAIAATEIVCAEKADSELTVGEKAKIPSKPKIYLLYRVLDLIPKTLKIIGIAIRATIFIAILLSVTISLFFSSNKSSSTPRSKRVRHPATSWSQNISYPSKTTPSTKKNTVSTLTTKTIPTSSSGLGEHHPSKKPSLWRDKSDVLSTAEIKWCEEQSIRIEAMRTKVNRNNKSSVEIFNRKVDDFNFVCGSFRYRIGELEAVREEVDRRRQQIWDEGLREAERLGIATKKPTQPPKKEPVITASQQIRDVQRMLISLGYKPGKVDGKYGDNTAAAVRAFQRDRDLNPTGLITQSLINSLKGLSTK